MKFTQDYDNGGLIIIDDLQGKETNRFVAQLC